MKRDEAQVRGATSWHLSCECGFRVESVDLDDLVEGARRHARVVHAMELSAEQVAALARRTPAEGG